MRFIYISFLISMLLLNSSLSFAESKYVHIPQLPPQVNVTMYVPDGWLFGEPSDVETPIECSSTIKPADCPKLSTIGAMQSKDSKEKLFIRLLKKPDKDFPSRELLEGAIIHATSSKIIKEMTPDGATKDEIVRVVYGNPTVEKLYYQIIMSSDQYTLELTFVMGSEQEQADIANMILAKSSIHLARQAE